MTRWEKLIFSLVLVWLLAIWTKISCAAVTVSVKPGDNIQNAINAAGSGGTIVLSQAGTYSLSSTATLLPGQTLIGTTLIGLTSYNDTTTLPGFTIPSAHYAGLNQSVIIAPNIRALNGADNITVVGITFAGSALWHSGIAHNWKLRNCIFAPSTKETAHKTVIEVHTFDNLDLADCLFAEQSGCGLDAFIYCYPATGTIRNCDFAGGGDGIHINGIDASTNQLVKECHFQGQRANPVEYQYQGARFELRDCWSDDPDYGNPTALMGFTLPGDKTPVVIATGNVVLANGQSNPNNRQRVGFEFAIAGSFSCTGNYVTGVRKPVTVTNAQTSGTVKGNCFENYLEATNTGGTDTNGGKVAWDANNYATVKQALLTRGRPGPLREFGQTPPTTQPIPPTTLPATLPVIPKVTHTLDIFDDGSFKVRP
jgi:hypothetical protein